MEKKLPKVLLACPTYEGKGYILERFVKRIKELTYSNYDILFVDNSKGDKYFNKIKKLGIPVEKGKWDEQSKIRLTNAQNQLREKFLEGNYDYFFSLEQDIIPPKDIIEQLIAYDKDIVGGWYYITKVPRPCLCREWRLVDMKFCPKPFSLEELGKEKLMKCFSASWGCCLVKRKVLEKIRFKVYRTFAQHSDTWFYFDCEKNNFEVYVDIDLLVPHFQDYKWKEILSNDVEIEKDLIKMKLEDGIK